MHLPKGRRSIGTDGDKGELDGKGAPNLQKSFEIGRITGKIDVVAPAFDDKAPIAAVAIAWRAAPPVLGRDVDHLEAIALVNIPPIQLVYPAESQGRDQLSQPLRDDYGYIFRQFA